MPAPSPTGAADGLGHGNGWCGATPGAVRRACADVTSQLASAGYRPCDVTHLALSHYHWDHTADANLFAGAHGSCRRSSTTRCSRPSRPAARGPRPTPRSRTPHDLDDGAEHDVFGDGTVIRQAHGPHPGPLGALREARQDRRRRAVGRPLSLSGRAHVEALADVRGQRSRNARRLAPSSRVLDAHGRTALDPARPHRARAS